MKRGLFVAPFNELADAAYLAEVAARAEARGWDGVFLWDHIQHVEAIGPIAEPWTCLATIAASTERIRLGALVTPLPRRRPWVLGRQAATLDRLSNGRLTLGLGVGGGGDNEWGNFGEETDMRTRAAMLDEGLGLLEALWSGDPVDHDGEHYTVRSRPFLPTPVQRPRIPIWLGARWPTPRPLRRAARYDGVFPIGIAPADIGELRERIARHRPPGAGEFSVVACVNAEVDHAPWIAAGVDWLLTDLGPTQMPDGVRKPTATRARIEAVVDAGPA